MSGIAAKITVQISVIVSRQLGTLPHSIEVLNASMSTRLSRSGLHIHSPLVHSSPLSAIAPCKIYLKEDFCQPSGSFKLRGISHFIKASADKIGSDPTTKGKKVVFCAASGGNAGNALSYAATQYGFESIVVIPLSTSEHMAKKLRENGSKVIVHGINFGEADAYLKEVVIPGLGDDCVAVYCHPYDHEDVWKGNSSLIDEVVKDLQEVGELDKLKGIVCSVGGGGLYNGVVMGLQRHGLFDVGVLSVETETCPTFQAAIDAGEPVALKSTSTIAGSLAATTISSKSLENYHTHKCKNILISDADTASACLEFVRDHSVVVEPACGASLATVYKGLLKEHENFFGGLKEDDIVIVVACGGYTVTLEALLKYKETYHL